MRGKTNWLILFLGCLTFFAAIVNLILLNVWTGSHRPRLMLVLKLPRSGSSWFVDSMNRLPHVFLSKEIIQQADQKHFDVHRRINHIENAFLRPTDKLSYAHHFFPSGRMLQDYWLHPAKWLRPIEVLGMTLNPETLSDLKLPLLFDHNTLSRLKIVVLFRTNVVKTTISGLVGKELKVKCGASNLRPADGRDSCLPPSFWKLDLMEFLSSLKHWVVRYELFWKLIGKLFPMDEFKVSYVSYEELQQGSADVIKRIMDVDMWSYSSVEVDAALAQPSEWEKRTNDDLSLFVTNFHDIISELSRHANCNVVVTMFNDKSPQDTLGRSHSPHQFTFFHQIKCCIDAFNISLKRIDSYD